MNWDRAFSVLLNPELALRVGVAFLLALLLIPALLPLARRLGLYDVPGGRKQHEAPTPYIGGVVVLVAVAATLWLFDPKITGTVYAFFACSATLVAVGLVDDLRNVSWKFRILVQVVATAVMVYMADLHVENLDDVFGISNLYLGWAAIPLTIFVVVGVINALNMIDGSDGLAGGLVLVSLLLFSAYALYSGDARIFGRLLVVAAAVAGFLAWNMRFPWQPRARVFLGNAGSMFLGFVIAWAAVRLTQNPLHPVSPVLGPWTIALPLMDCVTLVFRRLQQGRSPVAADRDHLHHLMLDAGFSPGRIAWLLMAVSLLLGLASAVLLKLGLYRPLLVVLFLAMTWSYYRFTTDRVLAVQRLAGIGRSLGLLPRGVAA